jgi:hypothetical protein
MLKLSKETTFPDLVNNFDLFHQYFSDKREKLKSLPSWNDDRNYSNIQHIDDLFASLDKSNIDSTLEYEVRVPISYIFSSPTYDRTRECFKPNGIKICIDHLNKEMNGTHLGFNSEAAGNCAAYIRYDKKTKTFIIVKHRGNHRVNMALLVTKGDDTEIKMTVKFHPIDRSYEEMIQIESMGHYIDAQENKGQTEADKFKSGVCANDPNQMKAFRFLMDNQINYKGIMQQMNVDGCDDWISLTSLTGLTSGEGNGIFKHYGEVNVVHALETIKNVAKITGETEVSSTALHCISQMYYCLTEFGKKDESNRPLFSKEELNQFFCDWFDDKNRVQSWRKGKVSYPIFGLCELTQSGSVKNYAYIYVKTFWPDIVTYWKEAIRNSRNGFNLDCVSCNQILLRTDKLLKGEVRTLLSNVA